MSFDPTQFFKTQPVLDHGHIELFDAMVQDPRIKIANAARVSFGKQVTELTERDIKLISFLYQHEHFSTFRHSYFSFRVKAPLMVFRQWWKYQVGCEWVENENVGAIEIPSTSWNEASGRYIEFAPEFYIPETIRLQSKDNKQGSHGQLTQLSGGEDPVGFFAEGCRLAYDRYRYLIDSGAAKEQTRMLLPQNIYSECVWTPSLQCLLYFLHQRLKPDAQWEIREYAKTLATIMMPLLKPLDLLQGAGQ